MAKKYIDIDAVVARVTEEVTKEINLNEATFSVSDLQEQLKGLSASGNEVAWSISYSTATAQVSVDHNYSEAASAQTDTTR